MTDNTDGNFFSGDKRSILKKIFDIAARICLIATIITAMTPTTADNKFVENFMLKPLNMAAGNFGYNVNADSGEVTDTQAE
ncbi:MAG: hypothetical protein H6850_00505 [Alphaproteobacteria bacterium]|nr:MAG: hypothetical protein H6850_00505 [Alphaproteobacteria bacterium]